ncbi:hypothetical protein FXB39_09825 [Nocardioides sp. BGMRC 2183]|nr:hypothetical protein FXB39_09825 [Nocardioides sp. BGMRC 2183]
MMRNAARNRCTDRTVDVSDPLSSSPTDPGSIMIDDRSRTAATVVALAPLLVGCGAAGPGDGATTDIAAAAPAIDRSQVQAVFGAGQLRYLKVDEPEDLADLGPTELALVGVIAGYAAGPDMFPDDESDHTVLMEVTPTEVFDGVEEGPIHVMFTVSIHTEVADLEAALPVGTPTALYLSQVARLPATFEGPVWVPVSPQGFIVEAHGTATFPMAPDLDDSQRLAEQVPGDVTVPD